MTGAADGRLALMCGPGMQMPGGMSAVIQTYALAGLFASGHVRYLSTYEGPGAFKQTLTMLRAVAKVLGLMIGRRLALLHVHSASRGSFWRKALLSRLVAAGGVPYVFHIHSGEFIDWYRSRSVRAQQWIRAVLSGAAVVVCLTPRWAAEIGRLDPRIRTEVLGNPVDMPEAPLLPSGGCRNVLFMGRLRQKKGVSELLQACASVMRDKPDLRLVMAGDEGEAMVVEHARRLDIEHRVDLPGWVEGPAKLALLSAADLYVLPSHFEGLPVGLLEAMACGVPVIATRVGGIPDLIEDGRSGLLVDAGDANGLEQAIRSMIENPDLRAAVRKHARETVSERYRVDVVLNQLSALYREVRRSK